jgi:hypothetical protein
MSISAYRAAWGLAFALLTQFSFPALAQFDPTAYRPVTLKDLAAEHPEFLPFEPKTDEKVALSAVPFKYRIRVHTTRTIRTIPPVRKKLIDDWAQMASAPSAFIKLYQRELLVTAGNQEIWVPIQEPLLAPLAKELPKGGELDLYVLFLGAAGGGWFLMATEFQSDFGK